MTLSAERSLISDWRTTSRYGRSQTPAERLIADGVAGIEVLAEALLSLARTDQIRILIGHWDDPQLRYARLDEAEGVLADARRYSSAEEIAHDLERVYYVNVDNIAE